jgi:phytoene synthase
MSEKPDARTPRYLAWLYSTPTQQALLGALCGIEAEIGASLRPGIDHHVAHTRLQWWREECERCAGARPAHPLTLELSKHIEESGPGAGAGRVLASLAGFVDNAAWDLAGATFERRQELTDYCRRWAAAMLEPLGLRGWSELGTALREIELLGELARAARSGRLRVPLDELEEAGVAPAALGAPPWPQQLTALLAARHQALRGQLSIALLGLSPEDQQRSRGVLVWASLAWEASARAQRALPHPPPPASIATAAATNWRAWRAARAAAAGSLRLA